MRLFASVLLSGVSLAGLSAPAFAETTPAEPAAPAAVQQEEPTATEGPELIVMARRKAESLQDVPLTVNAVTAEDLAKLNIRRMEDIQTVVPGLSLKNNANGIGAVASIRGVNFDVNASGNNGTVEFYLNDSPISVGNLLQAMYDVGQIEVLRGPQGTLRGRASPSGSITVTTHQADLSGWGGYINATGTTIGGINANAAVNVPIIPDMLAIRVSGVVDQTEGSRVTSVHDPRDPYFKAHGGRVSVRFDPVADLKITASYQKLIQNIRAYAQVESLQALDPTAPASPVFITARDRLAVADGPARIHQTFENFNWQAEYAFAGQVLNYAGAHNRQHFTSGGPADTGDFFGPTWGQNTKTYGQFTNTRSSTWSHEVRLQSEEMIAGLVDYAVGVFYAKGDFPTALQQQTLIFLGAPSPATPSIINITPITRAGGNRELSAFANLTFHIGDDTEIAGGLRYIDYKVHGSLAIGPNIIPAANENNHDKTWIYSGSIKHNFSDDLMVYGTIGTSWRPRVAAVGDFSVLRSPLENSFLNLPPEESTSYELGLKSSFLDKRVTLNVSAFHQDFKNYPYRSATGIYFIENTLVAGVVTPRVGAFNFVAAVPVKVNGVEADLGIKATDDWDIGLSAAYAKSKIKNGLVPCNDYFPHDGNPDAVATRPTVAQIQAVAGGENLVACQVNYRAQITSPFTLTGQTEYRIPISDHVGSYVRGQFAYYGKSQNDPANAFDNVSDYALLNLFAGIRDPNGAWEITAYAKNITNTFRVLTRGDSPIAASYNIGATGFVSPTTYRSVSTTQPREFGLNVRFAFGTR